MVGKTFHMHKIHLTKPPLYYDEYHAYGIVFSSAGFCAFFEPF